MKKNGQPIFGTIKQSPCIEYPCKWIYKIVGFDQDEMQRAVTEIIQDRSFKISFSRRSETGRYVSLNVELMVESESHRTDLYHVLKDHQAIKHVL